MMLLLTFFPNDLVMNISYVYIVSWYRLLEGNILQKIAVAMLFFNIL